MKKAIFTGLIVGILLGGWVIPVWSAPDPAPTAYEVLAAVNALRASYGLDPYLVDGLLMIAAQGQADYLTSMYPAVVDGHTGPGGTDADARALAVGFPYVEGLDINENWASLPDHVTVETLIYDVWGDEIHMHTMLHQMGQMAGVGVASIDGTVYYVLDVAAYWGDAGLTPQPTNLAYGENAATQQYVSQYIAPVIKADPREDGSIVHTVQSGQSLWMLAEHYDVDIDTLRQLNGLGTSDMVYIGQKILIRGPSPATSTPEPTEKATVEEITSTPVSNAPFTPFPLTEQTSQAVTDTGLDFSFWFLIFFGLFGLGLILIIVGMGQSK
jgi:LysM repeat protein